MSVVDVASLLPHLSLPLVLLVPHSVEHIAPDTHCMRRAPTNTCASFVLLIGVFLVAALGPLVQQWVQADEEQHIDHKQRYDPYDDDDNHLYNCGVPALIFALASGTELLLFSFYVVPHSWQDNGVTVAFVGRYVANVKFPIRLCTVHN